MSDLIERQALLDAITASINQFGGRYTTDQLNMWGLFSQMITELPPVTPKHRTDTLKAEIKRMKRAFTTCINSDYYTGYMSALSAVEGYIAKMEGVSE